MNTREQQTGTLYIVATPIGNLKDITIRALDILDSVDLIAAEDTRVTRKLLTAHYIQNHLISYHEHNKERQVPVIMDKLEQGKNVALTTDAGTPGISDPGFDLVNRALQSGISVVPIPGVSAVIAAVSVSGFSGDGFSFAGYIPSKRSKARVFLNSIRECPETTVLYETPHRIVDSLEHMSAILGSRRICVARELTKLHEQCIRGTCREVYTYFKEHPEHVRGEFTIVLSGVSTRRGVREKEITDGEIRLQLRECMERGRHSRKTAIRLVSEQLEISKNRVYRIATGEQ